MSEVDQLWRGATPLCGRLRKNGERCRAGVAAPGEACVMHDPVRYARAMREKTAREARAAKEGGEWLARMFEKSAEHERLLAANKAAKRSRLEVALQRIGANPAAARLRAERECSVCSTHDHAELLDVYAIEGRFVGYCEACDVAYPVVIEARA